MNPAALLQKHSFPFLLHLEWALLAIAALTELVLAPFFRGYQASPNILVLLVLLGVSGLWLPAEKQSLKWLYIVLTFGLVWLMTGTVNPGVRLFPFLYLAIVIRSCVIFQMSGRLLVTGAAFLCFLWTLFHRMQNLRLPFLPLISERIRQVTFTLGLNFAFLFGLILVFVLLLMNALLAERQSREQLALANTQLRQYALRIEDQATLQERNRIAREIHDSLGHYLTGLNIQIESALKLWKSNPARAQEFLAEAKILASRTLQEVRQSVGVLRSNPLHNQTLEAALLNLAQEFQRSTGILPICRLNLSQSLPQDLNTALYRITQEALTNICKYAQATVVEIALQETPTWIELRIHDNGVGFRLDQNTTGFGLQGIRERTVALGGELSLQSQPGQGCQIQIKIPRSGMQQGA